MRWRRITGAFPLWTTALLVGFIALQLFLGWEWLAWELPPLQRYYLPAYFHSTEDAKRPGAKTRIDPLFKTAPRRKREPIRLRDVVRGRDGDLPLQLSQSAIEQGWMGIEKGPPIWDGSAEVEDFLRQDFYQSRGFWQLIDEPLLYSCAFLLASIISAFFIREELATEWRILWTALEESKSRLDYRSDPPANRNKIAGMIGLRWELPKWIGKLWLRGHNRTLQASRYMLAERDEMHLSVGDPPPPTVSSPRKDSERRQLAESGLQETNANSSGIGSTRPVERRRIFPGKTDVCGSDQKPKDWDESQWID